MTGDPLVRLATPADAEAIATVHVASWRAAYGGIVPQPILDRLSVDRRAARWRETIAAEADERVWIVEAGGQVRGFASTGPSRDTDLPAGAAEVYAIYVDPGSWSGGLGRLLFSRAVAELDEHGCEPIVLWVLTANDRGRGFYEAMGWRPDGAGRPIDFDGSPVDEVRYRAP